MKILKTACLALATLTFAGPALADDAAAALKNYTKTGETEDCLLAYRIRDTQILNKHQILFRMYGGTDYLQEPSSCPGLNKWQALSYRVDASQLCSNTIVTLLDTGSSLRFAGTCSFTDFQKLKKIDAPTQ